MLKHTCSLLGHRPPTVSYPRHPSWKKNFRRRAKKDLFSSFWQGFRRTYYYFFLPIFYQSKKNLKFKLYKSIPFAWNREETEITPTPCEIHRLPYEKLSFSVIFSHEKPKLSSLTILQSIHWLRSWSCQDSSLRKLSVAWQEGPDSFESIGVCRSSLPLFRSRMGVIFS